MFCFLIKPTNSFFYSVNSRQRYESRDGPKTIPIRNVEANQPIKTHLLPFGKRSLVYPNRGLAKQVSKPGTEQLLQQLFMLRVEYSRAAACNRPDIITLLPIFPAAVSPSLSNMFKDALRYKDACSHPACFRREEEEMRMQEKYTWKCIVQTASKQCLLQHNQSL